MVPGSTSGRNQRLSRRGIRIGARKHRTRIRNWQDREDLRQGGSEETLGRPAMSWGMGFVLLKAILKHLPKLRAATKVSPEAWRALRCPCHPPLQLMGPCLTPQGALVRGQGVGTADSLAHIYHSCFFLFIYLFIYFLTSLLEYNCFTMLC